MPPDNHSQAWIARAVTRNLGPVWAACSSIGLVAVSFGVNRRAFCLSVQRLTGLEPVSGRPGLHEITDQVLEYVDGTRTAFAVAIDWSYMTSEFQRSVLRRVLSIPCGQTRTYGYVATEIGQPGAARAVGRANATNPMPLVIPCHRLLGADGKLHGYGGWGGLRTKAWLLRMEASKARNQASRQL